ncbi:MAG: hypothetical protein RRA15_11040 [bacterium]|nr:hypothetical protein [bacterium]MDT8367007.1 hypothetical protein [bacterium]
MCRRCVFGLTFLRTVKVKEKEPLGWEKEPSRGWWFGALLLVFVGVYLTFL